MKCKNVRQEIDHLLFEEKEKLTLKANQHVSECDSCREYYDSSLLVSKLSEKINKQEPVLPNRSELTEQVLIAIKKEAGKKNNNNFLQIISSINLQRVLAAASVCLMAFFGYEQYKVIDKLEHLENKMQHFGAISQQKTNTADFSLEGVLSLKTIIQMKTPEKFLEKINPVDYNKHDILAAYNSIKQGTIADESLKKLFVLSKSSADVNDFMELINLYGTESTKSIKFLNNSEL